MGLKVGRKWALGAKVGYNGSKPTFNHFRTHFAALTQHNMMLSSDKILVQNEKMSHDVFSLRNKASIDIMMASQMFSLKLERASSSGDGCQLPSLFCKSSRFWASGLWVQRRISPEKYGASLKERLFDAHQKMPIHDAVRGNGILLNSEKSLPGRTPRTHKRKPYPDPPILAFFDFLVFHVCPISLVFLCVFLSFPGIRGFSEENRPCFFRGFPVFFLQESKGWRVRVFRKMADSCDLEA